MTTYRDVVEAQDVDCVLGRFESYFDSRVQFSGERGWKYQRSGDALRVTFPGAKTLDDARVLAAVIDAITCDNRWGMWCPEVLEAESRDTAALVVVFPGDLDRRPLFRVTPVIELDGSDRWCVLECEAVTDLGAEFTVDPASCWKGDLG